ncbi:MAG: glycosyltransferase family 2 protein [Patescibacteria group bacterium]|nr:glycosyltransferase family 2 protein [Patescibacteria group bacterium]
MNPVFSIVMEAFLFVSLYIQVFLIITLFEHREALFRSKEKGARRKEQGGRSKEIGEGRKEAESVPTVSIIVPCFNEQATVVGTIESLKRLRYPADKLSILAVDDGSTDDTWSYLERYAADPQVRIFRKENGGKHTAMNLGIAESRSDIIGCLDADSFVHAEALSRMAPLFADPRVMAVTPAIKVRAPQTVLEHIQYAEYNIGIFLRKMYSVFNAIHVTPGPFSLFRRSVFEQVGPFKSAYNTEDLEMALRLHSHNCVIENAEHAYVYTTPPATVRALVKQRVRWTTGFLLNVRDYRRLFFSRKHGQIGTFTLPAGVISLVTVLFFAGYAAVDAATTTADSLSRWYLVGWQWHWQWPSFQPFFIDTTVVRLLTFALVVLALAFLFFGKRMATGSWKPSRDMAYYTIFYGFIAPVWVAISWGRALTRNVGSWR